MLRGDPGRTMPEHLHGYLLGYACILHQRVAGLSQIVQRAMVQPNFLDQVAKPTTAIPTVFL